MRTMLYINASHRSKPERDKLSGVRRFVRERDWELMPIFRQYGRPDLKPLLREVAPAAMEKIFRRTTGATMLKWRRG